MGSVSARLSGMLLQNLKKIADRGNKLLYTLNACVAFFHISILFSPAKQSVFSVRLGLFLLLVAAHLHHSHH